jgi:serine/threonine protein kinase/tetratricopeptide (TPR) repeat protein
MIGQTISHYRILEKLGGGGMGIVYKAHDLKLDRTVALKFLPSELTFDSGAKERFVHEAKAASSLDHNNICTVYDIDESADGRMFIAMACYEGETLKERIAKGQSRPERSRGMKVEEATDIAIQIAQGLAKAHECGIVHRDLKPANIMVTKDGVAKIVDFGLAKLSGRTLLTKSGTTMGTAAYMSPEQARGEQVDSRSDIWSLGVVFYEMLTGRRPFESDYEQAMVYSILNEEPKPLPSVRPEIPEAITRVVQKALRKNPDDRYRSMTELIADLKQSEKGKLPQVSRGKRLTGRRAVIALVELVFVLAIVAVIIFLTGGKPDIRSVAVLPIFDTIHDSAMAGVFDGLTEDVITNIGQLSHATKVISFNGVMKFKNKEVTPVQAGEELGVDAVAVCRVYRQGNEYNLRLEIVNVRDNTSFSNKRFDAQLAEMTVLPKRMAAVILGSFGVSVTDAEVDANSRQQTKNLDAYRFLQKGHYYHHLVGEADLRLAMSYYRKALELDPGYALAHGWLALGYMALTQAGLVPFIQTRDSTIAEARIALSMNEKSPEAHLALAMVKYQNFELREAAKGFERVLQLNPSHGEALRWYAHLQVETKHTKEGIAMMRRAIEAEPLNPGYQYSLGQIFLFARQWEASIQATLKVVEMDSSFDRGLIEWQLGDAHLYRGDTSKALEHLKIRRDRLQDWVAGIWYLYFSGNKKAADQEWEKMKPLVAKSRWWSFPFKFYAWKKDKEQTLTWLERAYDERDGGLPTANSFPEFDFLIGDPRFEALMKKAGFRD